VDFSGKFSKRWQLSAKYTQSTLDGVNRNILSMQANEKPGACMTNKADA
jgi:hypothetical protein